MAARSTNRDWLDQVVEESLEPDLPIIDPHHHLWEFRHERAAHHYLLDEVLEDVNAGHNVVKTVFVECGAMFRADGPKAMEVVGETEFVNGVAAMSASGLYGPCRIAAGIVGRADLSLGAAVGEVLDAHIAAGGGRFRGIRHQCTWHESPDIPNGRNDPPEHVMLDATFREGFAELAPRRLSFEAWCYHTQLPDLIDLASTFPDTVIILNHFGGPLGIGPYEGKQREIFPHWKARITELAAVENVVAKLGGLNMELNGFAWHERDRPPAGEALMEATRPWFEHTIRAFGPDRCLFESNFPVDMVSCGYNVLWNSFKRLVAGASAEEKARLFHDTAERVYRLAD